MTILDMGCGTGYLSSVLADHVGPSGSVLAVDPDLERLNVAKEAYVFFHGLLIQHKGIFVLVLKYICKREVLVLIPIY